ncbi:replication-relaxation family protein [Nocardiopsis exhalans]|uniref:Replication-relaxation family protein n=1 Tax=Nocardiopsis exhalans TaxID=163604 RepID=A0ABY5DB55_9ACTN|nr:replication-relaxation family protein [Nocardiopsis exhalans]USY20718.1 replication-relaxation family protein [Nocardiopsis exhalans]
MSTETDSIDILLSLVPKITPRDRKVLNDLYDHQVLTTHHLHQLHFAGRAVRTVNQRLRQLRSYELIAPFRPYAHAGTSPNHWVVDRLGVQWLAAQRNTALAELDYQADHRMRVALDYQLGHVLGLADTFVAFTLAARRTRSASLECWYSERESARRWGRHIRPDAYLQWDQDQAELHAFVEYDTGTEPLTKVARKMKGYTNLATESGLASIVLFAVHSDQRAEHLMDKLAQAPSAQLRMVGAYVSTHEQLHKRGPERAVWRVPGEPSGQRLSLVDIARRHPRKEQGQDEGE